LGLLMLALLPIFPALPCFALLRAVTSDQCCLSCLHWLLRHQDSPRSLRSSLRGTVLPCSPRNIGDTSFFQRKKALILGGHGVAIALLPSVSRCRSLPRHSSAGLLPVSSPLISCHCLLTLSFCGCGADRTQLDDTVFVKEGVTLTQVAHIKNHLRILRTPALRTSVLYSYRLSNSSSHTYFSTPRT
jgi:hypothetical protein